MNWYDKAKNFLSKYSAQVHIFLLAWNTFITSWATGLSVPLTDLGLPFSLNARTVVLYIQAHAHIPTWGIGLFTILANGTIAYTHWKKAQVKVVDVPAGTAVLVNQPVDASIATKGDTTVLKTE